MVKYKTLKKFVTILYSHAGTDYYANTNGKVKIYEIRHQKIVIEAYCEKYGKLIIFTLGSVS